MKTPDQIYQYILETNHLIPGLITLAFLLLIICITLIVAYRMKNKSYMDKCNHLILAVDALEIGDDKIESLEVACETFRKENEHILKVNKGMCLTKARISKEIVDELHLKRFAMEQTIRLLTPYSEAINENPIRVTDTFKVIMNCLTPSK